VLERVETLRNRTGLARIAAMLCRRVVRFDPDQYRLREGVSGLAAPFEHEDEHEHGL